MDGSDGTTDEAIVRRVLGGDVDAYALLVERYRARLLGLAYHLSGDWDTAADLAQESLVVAFECLDRIRDPNAFGQWVTAILRNKHRNLGRRKDAQVLSLDQLVEAGFEPAAPAPVPPMSDDERGAIARCVEALPEKYRKPLLLRYVDDLSYKDIADFLGVPVTTVTMRLTYARRMLAKKAKQFGLL
jgi:RNA polymerase sigma-70 factor (ECF subfamily)